jgi:hypothetical protein
VHWPAERTSERELPRRLQHGRVGLGLPTLDQRAIPVQGREIEHEHQDQQRDGQRADQPGGAEHGPHERVAVEADRELHAIHEKGGEVQMAVERLERAVVQARRRDQIEHRPLVVEIRGVSE